MSKPNTCCAPAAQPSAPLTSISHDDHRRTVRDAYAQVAQASDRGEESAERLLVTAAVSVTMERAINTLVLYDLAIAKRTWIWRPLVRTWAWAAAIQRPLPH